MFMDPLGDAGEQAHVPLVPEARHAIGAVVGARVDGAVFGIDHAPAALGLDLAEAPQAAGKIDAHAGAMGHLVEAIGRGDRADAQRLEQKVVARIARRRASSDGRIAVSAVIT